MIPPQGISANQLRVTLLEASTWSPTKQADQSSFSPQRLPGASLPVLIADTRTRHAQRSDSVGLMVPLRDLSLNEWAVLGLIAEGRTHGFAISREFMREGALGRIWTIPRPLIYRAITSLMGRELVVEVGAEPGAGGPERHLVEVTSSGAQAFASWANRPVTHIRDARTELLLKLLFLDRSGSSPDALLRAQQAQLIPMRDGLRAQLESSTGFDATLARWRLYSADALARLVEELLDPAKPEVG